MGHEYPEDYVQKLIKIAFSKAFRELGLYNGPKKTLRDVVGGKRV